MQEGKLLTEHLILSMCPDFLQSRTPQIPKQKYTSEYLFIEQLLEASVKFQLFFKKGKKTETVFYVSSVLDTLEILQLHQNH